MRASASTTAGGCTTKAAAAADINRGADDIISWFSPDVLVKEVVLKYYLISSSIQIEH
jgi:hypothetical protein